MTNNNHPITPPPELVEQWAHEYWDNPDRFIDDSETYIATQSACWGYKQRSIDIAAFALRAVAEGWRAEFADITQTDFIRGIIRGAEALEEMADEVVNQLENN